MDQLKKRGFSLASRCALCGKDEESLEHLLIHCPKVWCMWTAIFSVWRGVGLPFSGERLDAGLATPPPAEKGCKVMESGPSLFDLGYLEREE